MNYDYYEAKILQFCEMGDFETAEREKQKIIPSLKVLLKNNDVKGIKILRLFSQLAGEAESFENFSNLLEELLMENLITKNYAEDLIADSPASRWL